MSHLVLWIGTLGLSTDSYGIGMTGEWMHGDVNGKHLAMGLIKSEGTLERGGGTRMAVCLCEKFTWWDWFAKLLVAGLMKKLRVSEFEERICKTTYFIIYCLIFNMHYKCF